VPREMTDFSYRTVIRREGKRSDGSNFSYDVHYGPYDGKGPAKGVLTRELNWAECHDQVGTTVTGWVEQAQTKWEKVED